MLHFSLIAAISLDGYIARIDNTHAHMDWTSTEDWNFFQSKLAEMDAVIVGRHTFETAEVRLRKRNTFVFSRQLDDIKTEGSVIWINPEKHDMRKLFTQQKYKNIAILGGRTIYTWAMEKDFCDEIFLTIEPIILGDGVRFLDVCDEQRYILKSSKILNATGTLLLHYTFVG